eukprot:8918511-Lingulodinium_polyedra.AAC.1
MKWTQCERSGIFWPFPGGGHSSGSSKGLEKRARVGDEYLKVCTQWRQALGLRRPHFYGKSES